MRKIFMILAMMMALTLSAQTNFARIVKDGKVVADVLNPDQVEFYRYEYVDLGLSVKWAKMNMGADRPEAYGSYFAWGELDGDPYIEGQTSGYNKNFGWGSYKLCDKSQDKLLKYTSNDGKTVLESIDDAAMQNLNPDWRIPSYDEWNELRSQCYWQSVSSYNGNAVKGYMVYMVKDDSHKGQKDVAAISALYSESDVHIFLPKAGRRSGNNLENAGSSGYYWSNALRTETPVSAFYQCLATQNVELVYFTREYGFTIRPVYDPQEN